MKDELREWYEIGVLIGTAARAAYKVVRRDMFAAAAMQGLVQWPLPEAVAHARECADALMAELDREET